MGSGEHNVELARRQIARDVIDRAKSQDSPDAAEALTAAAASIDPSIASSRLINGLSYEVRVRGAVARALCNSDGISVLAKNVDDVADVIVEKADGKRIAIEVKYLSRGPLGLRTFEQVARFSDAQPVILVTNVHLSQAVLAANSDSSSRVEAVVWNGPSDDDGLIRAIHRSLAKV